MITKEQIETARAKVAGLEAAALSVADAEDILHVLTVATCDDPEDASVSIAHAKFLRYAEALGGSR